MECSLWNSSYTCTIIICAGSCYVCFIFSSPWSLLLPFSSFFFFFLLLPSLSLNSPLPLYLPFPYSSSSSPPPLLLFFPFSGAHPTSRVDVEDGRIPLDISIYAYPRYRFNDMNTSATPAIAFIAVIHSLLSTSANASFKLFNLPHWIQRDTQRVKQQMTPPLTNNTPVFLPGTAPRSFWNGLTVLTN